MDNPGPSTSDGNAPPKKKTRTWRFQSFKKFWIEDPRLKPWLIAHKDGVSGHCKVCDITLKHPNKTNLLVHMETAKHKREEVKVKSTPQVKSFFQPKKNAQLAKHTEAEILMTGFFAEHHLPFELADHMSELLKVMFPDSKIAQEMHLKHSKLNYIMQDGIAYTEKYHVAKICQKQKFSIIIDECTDVSVSQILAVVVRYLDYDKMCVVDALLDSIEVDEATAESLYSGLKKLFSENKIPISNVIGFASDNCNVMMGKHSGFQALLKKDVPSVFILGCICHSLALCASKAASVLPSWLESFMKGVGTYFSKSSKRQHEYQLLQEAVSVSNKKILKLSTTRWLSRGMVISRLIEQWDALKIFFQTESISEKDTTASTMFNTMNTPGSKHMLFFLNYVLQKVDIMNLIFQSETFKLHILYNIIHREYRLLLSMFVKDSILDSDKIKLFNIDPKASVNHKEISDVFVGGRCEAELKNNSLGQTENLFRNDCKKFLIILCSEIRKRFHFEDNSIISYLSSLDPKEALSKGRKMKNISLLANNFPMLIPADKLDKLEDEWRELLVLKAEITDLVELEPPQFWLSVGKLKNCREDQVFPLLSNFMADLTVLPHSSASAERVFSQVNLVKTKKTNRLTVRTTANRLLARQALVRSKEKCFTWKPSQDLVDDILNGNVLKRHKDHQHDSENLTLYSDDNSIELSN